MCGAANVRSDTPWCASRVRAITPPEIVAVPADREQLAAILKLATAEKFTVTPVGGGTKRNCGGIARRVDLAVSTERMQRVIDYPASDLTITVEAGITIRALRETLAQHGQMLPLDVTCLNDATLGGTLAANLSGPQRLGYGGWRDVVIGIQFVTADGRLAKGGGRVVKNVAGYDLPKLLIGSFGTLGIITEVSLKVFPIPPATGTFVFGFSSIAAATEVTHAILNSPFFPQSLELLDAAAGALAGVTGTCTSPYIVFVSVAGPQVVVDRASNDLPKLLRGNGCLFSQAITDGSQDRLWNSLSDMTSAYLRAQPAGVAIKASLPLLQLTAFIGEAKQLAEDAQLSTASGAHAGTGIVYQYLWPEGADRGPEGGDRAIEKLPRVAEQIVSLAERLGGRATVEWFPLAYDGKLNPWGKLGDDFPLMQRIKSALDPHGTLNPSRFYGGI